tara:strand:- start:160451 stop:161398 length:948 start_codon:yes stop_codon:yes gene_type:complete
MEEITKLPILKTVWAANREFFKQLFNVKVFLTFLLPTMLIFGFENMLSDVISHSPENVSFAVDSMLVLGFSIETLAAIYLLLVLVYLFLLPVLTLNWHRHMILNSDLKLNPIGRFKLLGRFVRKVVWIWLVMMCLAIPMVLLGYALLLSYATFLTWVDNLWIAAPICLLVAVVIAWMWVKLILTWTRMTLLLPATAVNVQLNIREIMSISKLCAGRLFVTQFLAVVAPLLLIVAVVSLFIWGLSGVEFLEPSTFMFVTLVFLGGLVSVFFTVVPIGVLSIFYMHYIVPQLPKIEKMRAEKEALDAIEQEGQTPSE